MHKAVDVTVKTDEDAKVGDRLNAARNFIALGVIPGKRIPRVLRALLDAKRNPAALLINIEHHDFNFVA